MVTVGGSAATNLISVSQQCTFLASISTIKAVDKKSGPRPIENWYFCPVILYSNVVRCTHYTMNIPYLNWVTSCIKLCYVAGILQFGLSIWVLVERLNQWRQLSNLRVLT